MIELPDAIYREGESLAQAMGFTLDQLIVRALQRELSQAVPIGHSGTSVSLPLIHSKQPGT